MKSLKTIFIPILFFVLSLTFVQAQTMKQVQVSPKMTICQTIGITNTCLDYSRPAVAGRQILGGLVPYDEIWRAGANENTTISFDNNVVIAGQEVPAGTYGLHMIPGETEWKVILNSENKSWGSYFYNKAKDVVRTKALMESVSNKQERLLFGFEAIKDDGANIVLYWDDFKVSFPIVINTKEIMVDYLENEYLKGLAGFSWQGFNAGANYCLTNNIQMDKAMNWIDQSISMNKNFTNTSTKSLILRGQGQSKEADELIASALDGADENQLNTYGYALLYTMKDVDAALKIFQKNAKANPKSWNVFDSLAEAYQVKGNKKEAIKNYEKALGMAPENQRSRIKSTLETL